MWDTRAGKCQGERGTGCSGMMGKTPVRIRFPNSQGDLRTWKLFARFAEAPSSPWDKPESYEYRKAQWMLAGADVWGCSYEALTEYLHRIHELGALLKRD